MKLSRRKLIENLVWISSKSWEYAALINWWNIVHRSFRLQTICHHRRSHRNMSPAYPGIRFHRRPMSCRRHQARFRRATASCDARLTRPISHPATIPPISTARVLSLARRTNPYTNRLIPDRRRNCRVITPCIPAMGRPRLLNHRARCLPLKKWVWEFCTACSSLSKCFSLLNCKTK